MSNAGKKGKRKTRIAPPKISPDLGHRYIFRVSPRPFVKTGGLITVALRVLAPHSRHRKIITDRTVVWPLYKLQAGQAVSMVPTPI